MYTKEPIGTSQRLDLWLVPFHLQKPRAQVLTGLQTPCHPLSYAPNTVLNLFFKRLLTLPLENGVFSNVSQVSHCFATALTSAWHRKTKRPDGLQECFSWIEFCTWFVVIRSSPDLPPLNTGKVVTWGPTSTAKHTVKLLRKVMMDEVVSFPGCSACFCVCLCPVCACMFTGLTPVSHLLLISSLSPVSAPACPPSLYVYIGYNDIT